MESGLKFALTWEWLRLQIFTQVKGLEPKGPFP